MNQCRTCRYLGEPQLDLDDRPTGFYHCNLITHIGIRSLSTVGEETKAIVEDASGYFAALVIRGDFGCNQWKPK